MEAPWHYIYVQGHHAIFYECDHSAFFFAANADMPATESAYIMKHTGR